MSMIKRPLKKLFSPKKDSVLFITTTSFHASGEGEATEVATTHLEQSLAGQSEVNQTLTQNPPESVISDAYGIKILHNVQEPVVDIIFIHGLTGGQVSTWTANGAAQPWPQALLSEDTPNARISAFGYDADVAKIFGKVGQNKIAEHAGNLVTAIADMRFKTESTPPIIFVAHSLGGLVCQKMLNIANIGEAHLQEVLESTLAIIFLGTPHRGSDLADWAKIASNLFNVARRSNSKIVGVLQPDSEVLQNVTQEFHNLRQSRADKGKKINIACYGEGRAMSKGGPSVMVVPTQSARLGGCAFNTISGCDHSSMTKFATKDSEYEKVCIQIQRLIKATILESDKPWSDEERECEQLLRTSEYERHKQRNPDRLENTCQWLLTHPNFQIWYQSNISSLLWVSADPGCGKSVLVKSLVEKELRSTASRTTCYFFFKDDDEKQTSVTHALSALLHQLFEQKKSLIKHAIPEYRSEGKLLPTLFHKLWTILTNAAADPKAGEVVCILDALDECEESSRYDIIHSLNMFYKASSSQGSHSRLKFLVTSRPYRDIEQKFTDLVYDIPTVRLQGENESRAISEEINLVIHFEAHYGIGKKLKLDDTEKLFLEKKLSSMPHRTYLWLKLIIEVILKSPKITSQNMEDTVSKLPVSIEAAYEAILEKSSDKVLARKLLSIVVAAIRPLTLEEMNIALAIQDDQKSLQDLDLDNESRFKETMRDLCGLFVTVVDQKIYLIHQTAKEFLLADTGRCDGAWRHSIEPAVSELIIARTCIIYLLFTDFNRHLPVQRKQWPDSQNEVSQYTYRHKYMDYATRYWTIHYRKAQNIKEYKLLESVLELYDTKSQRSQNWYFVYRTLNNSSSLILSQFTNSMILSSYFGHEKIVWALLEKGADLDYQDKHGMTALQWAAKNGHGGIVQVLLEKGANPNHQNKDGVTALVRAASNGNKAVFQMLLKKGADLDHPGKHGMTELLWAAKNGQEGIVQVLLQNGAKLNHQDKYGMTALLWAANNGHEATVQVLLEKGANPNHQDIDGVTALLRAAANGHEVVVQALLEKGANKDHQDKGDMAALVWAARNGREGVVRILQTDS